MELNRNLGKKRDFFESYKERFDWRSKDTKVKTTKLCRISGEAWFLFTRGKKRLGFDLNMRIKYVGTLEYKDARGLIEFKEFCDDKNFEYTIRSRGEANK